VGDDDDGDAPGCVDGREDDGAGEAHTAAARRTRMAKAHMDVQWGHPMYQLGRTGQGWDGEGENCRRKELL
jgi:hypothetical protein